MLWSEIERASFSEFINRFRRVNHEVSPFGRESRLLKFYSKKTYRRVRSLLRGSKEKTDTYQKLARMVIKSTYNTWLVRALQTFTSCHISISTHFPTHTHTHFIIFSIEGDRKFCAQLLSQKCFLVPFKVTLLLK